MAETLRKNAKTAARKTLILYFLLDVSGSMRGKKIESLNSAMREMCESLGGDIVKTNDKRTESLVDNSDVLVKIAILKFGSGTEWVTPPTELNPEIFKFHDLEAVKGACTDMGEACLELNSKLNYENHLIDQAGYKVPAFLLLSDGAPTDDFESGLAQLKKNPWFSKGSKIALAVGEDADEDVLSKFTADGKVFPVNNREGMIKLIKLFTMTASKVGSTNASSKDKQKELNDVMEGKDREVDPEEEVDVGWDTPGQ